LRDVTFDKNFDNISKETTNLHREIQKLDLSKTDRAGEICDPSILHGLVRGSGPIHAHSKKNGDFGNDQTVTKFNVNKDIEEKGSEIFHSNCLKRTKVSQSSTEKAFEMPRTSLQIERDIWFRQAEHFSREDASDESDLLSISGSRVDQQMMTRAELSMMYEKKEASRRNAEWSSRLLPWEKQAYKELGEPNIKRSYEDYFDFKLSLPTLNKD
jgi:hypothetical protein